MAESNNCFSVEYIYMQVKHAHKAREHKSVSAPLNLSLVSLNKEEKKAK